MTILESTTILIGLLQKTVAWFDIRNPERTSALSKRFFCARFMAGRVRALRSAAPRSGMSTLRGLPPLFDINGGSSLYRSEDTTMSDHTYSGVPEKYLIVDSSQELDINALHCALERASSVCKMLTANFDISTQDKFNDHILLNACWALDGLLDQALILSLGKDS